MSETLEDFLRAKKKKDEELKQAVDWEKRKTWWLGKINELYKEVKEWLGPLTSEDILNIKDDTVDIHEERLGTYRAPYLDINVGSEVVKLMPVGAIIIAALGRVDLIGEEGSVKIALEQKGHRPQVRAYIVKEEIAKSKKQSNLPDYDQMDTEWIVPTETGRPKKYQILTKEVFHDALKRVMTK